MKHPCSNTYRDTAQCRSPRGWHDATHIWAWNSFPTLSSSLHTFFRLLFPEACDECEVALVSGWPLTFIHRTCPYYPFMQRTGRFPCHQLCNDFPAIFPAAPCALGMGKGLSQGHRHFHSLILVSVLVWSQGPQPGQQLPRHLLCPSSSLALQSRLAPGSSPHTSVSASLRDHGVW